MFGFSWNRHCLLDSHNEFPSYSLILGLFGWKYLANWDSERRAGAMVHLLWLVESILPAGGFRSQCYDFLKQIMLAVSFFLAV